MNVVYNILVVIAVLIAITFSLLVLVTGKGDAMNGGGSVRTTFKGKASFDDIMSKWTLAMGVAFMALILVVDVVAKRLDNASLIPATDASESTNSAPSVPVTNTPAVNVPTTNAPASIPAPTNAAPTSPAPTSAPETGSVVPPTTDAPLDSAPATSSSSTSPSEPLVVPSIPNEGPTSTTTGGATNAAPPAGNR